MWLWLLGCGDKDANTDSDSDSGADTGSTAEVDESFLCVVQPDNALRVDCTVVNVEPAGLALTATDPDGEVIEVSREPATTHQVTLWGLRADTVYTVTDGVRSTEVTTGPVPAELLELEVDVTGATADIEASVHVARCGDVGYVVAVDALGALRWYQAAQVEGLSWTEPPGLLALVDRGIREWTAAGVPGLAIDAADIDVPLHHDLHRLGDRTAVLFNENIVGPDELTYLVDGVLFFDPDGSLAAEWHLADHIDPAWLPLGTGGPNTGPGPGGDEGLDWSHANGITATDDGDLIVSFRWIDAVYRIDAKIGTPGFGDVKWILTGTETSPVPSSFVWEADDGLVPGFIGQHHATLVGDRLWLFDNRVEPESSRAIAVDLDLDAGIARIVQSHAVGERCDVQGGAAPLPGGGVLATCAGSGVAYEFAADGGDVPLYTVRAACPAEPPPGGGGGQYTIGGGSSPRVLPIHLP